MSLRLMFRMGLVVVLALGLMISASASTAETIRAHGGDTTLGHACAESTALFLNLVVTPGLVPAGNFDCTTLGPGWLNYDTGDISGVAGAAGSGITGGAASGLATLGTDPNVLQLRVAGTCAAGSSIRVINVNGTVACEADDTGAGWSLTGNSGTTAGTNFLGTTDNQALQLHVNGARALRLEPNATSPNFLGGSSANNATVGVVGAAIAGGGTPLVFGVPAPNRVTDDYGTVSGGRNNRAGNDDAFTSDEAFASVGGGEDNTASGDASTVGGGRGNTATDSGESATIAGGEGNTASFGPSSVGGGINNQAFNGSTIGGGLNNDAFGPDSTIGGGLNNQTGGPLVSFGNQTIGGGQDNVAGEKWGTIGGGQGNSTTSNHGTVGGGLNNRAGDNSASGAVAAWATVAGGSNNQASALNATIGGGDENEASGQAATVAGGDSNRATGQFSFIAGGTGNTAGAFTSVLGHHGNGGAHTGAFLFSDSDGTPANAGFATVADREFAVRARGGVRFQSSLAATGVQLNPGASAWSILSDRDAKENFTQVDGREILEKLSQIPVETWNYRAQDSSIRHIGPMAQDFYAAFGVGKDEKHISTVDSDGVALAAIQGVHQLMQEKDVQIAELEKRIEALEAAADLKINGGGLFSAGGPGSWALLGGILLIGGIFTLRHTGLPGKER